MTRTVEVALPGRRYAITIGAGLLGRADLQALAPGRQVFVVTDFNVAPLYLDAVRARLPGRDVQAHAFPAGEEEKTLATFTAVIEAMARAGLRRDGTVFALGGGVVGDLAGFAAACWMRGVRCVQLPTTLLAMVDSSVGGKTAVDLPAGKNLVGAFHQPSAVVIDTDTLRTLPARELRAGLAEVLKYGAIVDPAFFDWIAAQADALLAGDAVALEEAIARSCAHKAAIVARDETEQGERMLLNFGHSFGHAIEAAQGYGGLLHGEAVAIGMVLAARLSSRLGLAPVDDALRLATTLSALGLPTAIPPGLGAEGLLARMRLDKKAVSGGLRLILWRGIGAAEVRGDVPEDEILAVLGGG